MASKLVQRISRKQAAVRMGRFKLSERGAAIPTKKIAFPTRYIWNSTNTLDRDENPVLIHIGSAAQRHTKNAILLCI